MLLYFEAPERTPNLKSKRDESRTEKRRRKEGQTKKKKREGKRGSKSLN